MAQGKRSDGKPRTDTYSLYIEPVLDDISTLIANGFTEKAVAEYYGVSQRAFASHKTKHPALVAAIKKGKQKILPDIVNSLVKRAKGYEYEEVLKAATTDPINNRITRQQVKTVKRHVPADTGAARFWLEKRFPQIWGNPNDISLEQRREITDEIYDKREKENWTAARTAREFERQGCPLPRSLEIELRVELEQQGSDQLPTPVVKIVYPQIEEDTP